MLHFYFVFKNCFNFFPDVDRKFVLTRKCFVELHRHSKTQWGLLGKVIYSCFLSTVLVSVMF